MTTLATAAALAAGYVLGRWRPWTRLGNWADRRVRDDGRWWLGSWPRQAVIAAVFVATWPRGSLYAWRHRNDPEPTPEPAPQIDPYWPRRPADTTEEADQ